MKSRLPLRLILPLRLMLFGVGLYLLWPWFHSATPVSDDNSARDKERTAVAETVGIPLTCVNERTQNQYSPSIIPEPASSAYADEHQLNMWVEDFRIRGATPIIQVAVATWGLEPAYLAPADGAYFTDSNGNRYAMVQDRGAYDPVGDAPKLKKCLPHEICRVLLEFAPLPSQTSFIYFHHPQFEDVKLTLDWSGFNKNH
jgi:hypothetical protein